MLPTIGFGSYMIGELIGREVIKDTAQGINSSVLSLRSFNNDIVNLILDNSQRFILRRMLLITWHKPRGAPRTYHPTIDEAKRNG